MSQSLRAENTQTTQKLEKWFDEFISAIQIQKYVTSSDQGRISVVQSFTMFNNLVRK